MPYEEKRAVISDDYPCRMAFASTGVNDVSLGAFVADLYQQGVANRAETPSPSEEAKRVNGAMYGDSHAQARCRVGCQNNWHMGCKILAALDRFSENFDKSFLNTRYRLLFLV
jgi:hypothetical protein